MRVFLSSTAMDLRDHRQAVDDVLLRLQAQATVMERFGPLPNAPVDECEAAAASADLVVCLVAHRCGYVPDRRDMRSITRREVEAARAAGKPVLVWMVADDAPWAGVKESDRLNDPLVQDDEGQLAKVLADVKALRQFKDWLRKDLGVEAFTTPDDLAKKVAVAVSQRIPGAAPAQPARGPEVRVIHALQPAPRFEGRAELVAELSAWVQDVASPDRVWALVAAGGTGKTAVIEQVLRAPPAAGSTLVWSFYEKPDADAFLAEAASLFLGETGGAPGGRLERLERGLRDGKPHLIVLDGVERVQAEAGNGRARGELEDHTLKLLLRALSAGLGRARALITSRFPLVDLADWERRGYRATRLDDLPVAAAVAVFRQWGVKGTDKALADAAELVGRHALSVDVIGSYLHHFTNGDVGNVAAFDLASATGDDPKAAKLARVIASYAAKLFEDERALLTRLSVFPRGVSIGILQVLVDAGGEVAGVLIRRSQAALVTLLERLRGRGLVFQYGDGDSLTWTAHPFLRDHFRALLGVPQEQVYEVVRAHLAVGLESRPATPPRDKAVLDRYEALIEAARLAGRVGEAFGLYYFGLGGYKNLGWRLGDYARGLRVTRSFSPSGRAEDLAVGMSLGQRAILLNAWALYGAAVGDLAGARALREVDNRWKASVGEARGVAAGLLHTAQVLIATGELRAAAVAANGAAATQANVDGAAFCALVTHLRGDAPGGRDAFGEATRLAGFTLTSGRGAWHARHHLDHGALPEAVSLCDHGLAGANRGGWQADVPRFHHILARIALLEDRDPTPHLDVLRDWTSRSGEMEWVINTHLLTASLALREGDPANARDEATLGLDHAAACGYGLLRIELLVLLSRIALALPDAGLAIQHARDALDRAAHPDCGYAWGEADAAQAWGEAYLAHHEPTLAARAFERALAVRTRIEHPGVEQTRGWLARVR